MLRNLKELKHFLGNSFFDPCDPYVTFDPTMVIWYKCHVSGVLVTKFGWNRSRHVEAISLRSVARRKKEELDMLPSQTAYPAGFETSTPDWPQFPCFPANVMQVYELHEYTW